MVATVFVLNLYNKKDEPVPHWVNRVVVTYMARILCMCECVSPGDDERARREDIEMNMTHANEYALKTPAFDDQSKARQRKTLKQRLNRGHHYRQVDGADTSLALDDSNVSKERTRNAVSFDAHAPSTAANQNRDCFQSQYYIQNGDSVADTQLTQTTRDDPTQQQQHVRGLQQQQSRERRRKTINKTKEQRQAEYSKDWVHVAAVCDRLFFWFCLIFITITTLMLFHPLTTSRFFRLPMLEKQPPP